MSEFSESYHLKTRDTEEVINLIKKSGLKGFVFSEFNGWVSFVVEGEAFVPNDLLIENNKGVLLNYSYAEDYGWGFTIYEDNRQVCSYSCTWGDDIEIDDSELDYGALNLIVGNNSGKENGIREILYIDSPEEIFDKNPAENFADIIGLVYYEWLSYDYIMGDLKEYKEQYPDLIEIEI